LGQRVAALRPSLVVLELGVNDMSNDVAPATMKAHLLTLISRVQVVCTVPPSFCIVGIYQRAGSFTNRWSAYVEVYGRHRSRRPARRLLPRDRAAARLQHRHGLCEESDVRAWIEAYGRDAVRKTGW
jgi:hypothetical protein